MTPTEKALREAFCDLYCAASDVVGKAETHGKNYKLYGPALDWLRRKEEFYESLFQESKAALPPAVAEDAGKDEGCICKGNWRQIIADSEPDFLKRFIRDGKRYIFEGVVWASDDLYYLMVGEDGRRLLDSCVSSLETLGYAPAPVADAAPEKEKINVPHRID